MQPAAAAAASWCCAGEKKDAIDHWASEVRDLEKQIVKARKAVEQGPATSSYFVFFHRCRGTLRAGWSVCLPGCACSPKPFGGPACGSWISRAICWVGSCRLSQCMLGCQGRCMRHVRLTTLGSSPQSHGQQTADCCAHSLVARARCC